MVAEIERLSEKLRDSLAQNETDAGIIKSDGKEIHFLRQQLSGITENRDWWISEHANQVIRTNEEIHIAAYLQRKLSAAQADSEQLVKALLAMFNSSDPEIGGSPGSPLEMAREAIAAHKARQGKEQQ